MTLRERWQHYLSHDAPPLVQFVKYGLAGGIATVTHVGSFFLAGFLLFPCVGADDPLVRLFNLAAPVVNEALRARYAVYSNLIAFGFSNTVCYLINRWFVFRPGRHHVVLEFLLFLGVSAISMTVGTTLMGLLIKYLGMPTTYAFGANILSSLAINYVLRKYFVFKG
ncbi:MAG TPA: GtrA family protein [Kiritimatiellia bacterium]|jgi:putative flippase GtrA|nr:GtrA family protein [Kiritimatiellia bacterium]OQC59272.1 MAG: GtrA-like protein [Verrucomicrobia bacterium ADurb.Bin018]MBP9571895.1 GtrA family protein [Kiritimatiellia bacterium]HOD99672.1 GtrA family protein [Kiritimatiellia bacterium]HOE36192.1 GtrA family protein [Kiritimatiellia bacterium]